jgi:AraC-like DNA-binding protein
MRSGKDPNMLRKHRNPLVGYAPIDSSAKWGSNRIHVVCLPSPGIILGTRSISYWEMVVPDSCGPAPLHVLPDGCMNLVFILDQSQVTATIHGIRTAPQTMTLQAGLVYVGVRLRPGQAYELLGEPVRHFTRTTIALEEVWPQHIEWLQGQLLHTQTFRQRVECLEVFLSQNRRHSPRCPPGIIKALQHIVSHPTQGSIASLARHSGLSLRQLRRQFDTYVGVSPKQLRQIMRFQHTLKVLPGNLSQTYAAVAVECGYFDQAHFIHDFAALYGAPPSHYRNAACHT